MKRILVISFIIILSSSNVAFSQFPNPPLSGLIAYYPFNGNPNDVISGNWNNGTIHGGVTFVSDRLGNANSSAYFNGTDAWIEIKQGNSITFPMNTSFSIVATVKLIQKSGTSYGGANCPVLPWDWGTIFSRYGGAQPPNSTGCGTGSADGIILDFNHTNKIRFGVNENPTDIGAEIYATVCNWYYSYHNIIAIRNANAGNQNLNIYVDGILKASTPYPVTGSNSCNVSIWIGATKAGCDNNPLVDFLKGNIDDMAIYNRVLTPAEIAAFNFVTPVPIPNVTVNSSICQGSSYTLPNGTTVTSAGTYIDTLKTTLGCDSIYITTNLTVNPLTVGNPATYTICSDDYTNIGLIANFPSTFTWTIGTITGGITGASAGSGSTINQVLHNPSTTTAGSVQYIVTPTSISGGCVGLPFIITVIVNPVPNPSNIYHQP